MKNETTKKLTLVFFVTLVSFLILAPLSASAGLVPCGLSEDNPNTDWDETTECDLCGFLWLIKNVMDLILELGGVICFLIVVSGAILLLVAGGSENLIAIGKKILTSAIIGLVIILSSWLIISAIFGATGYNYADNWYEFECEGPAPPTSAYLTCENGACVEKDGDKDDECKTNEDCRHLECKGMVCETINQPGANTCDRDKDCYYLACDENFDCEKTEGKGTDECSPEGSKCPSHLECARYGKCILVEGGGPNKDGCAYQDQSCSAWHLDCNPISLICEKVLGGGKDRCEVIDTRCRLYYLKCDEDNMCIKIWDVTGTDECEEEEEPCEVKPACNDGEDNDGDGTADFYGVSGVYSPDPGCTSKDDNSEKNSNGPQCDNGRDDDGDNKADYKADGTGDPECTSPDDNDEWNGQVVEPCEKDSDCELGKICEPIGGGQKGCVSGCRTDPDCPSGQICVNGECKDGCRDCQAGQKPVCYKRHDRCPGGICTEFKCCSGCVCECRGWWECLQRKDYCYPSGAKTQCSDGKDNDKDGYTDQNDRACHESNDINKPYHSEYDDESAAKTTECSDGQDNDGDLYTDYPSDPGCTSADDNDEKEENPFEGYTLQVNEKQKDHASQSLMALLACMKEKLPEEARVISSISDDHLIGDSPTCQKSLCSGGNCIANACPEDTDPQGQCNKGKTTWKPNTCCLTNSRTCNISCNQCMCADSAGCQHGCNSCHYGGRNCNTQERFSYAVDFGNEKACDEIKKAALECNADAFVNYEGTHVHVSIGAVSGCGCDTGTGKDCP